ncbi:hypothetical protein DER46DRAFT_96551 [Fusarium sp. MPI-SDFR-AT-0072]|nr:hypothetical protein DER46DRAFT_96551 [Fusarium sp. MPI-SDFR-AT-0072]
MPYYGFLCLTLILCYHITHLVSLINNCNLIIDSTRRQFRILLGKVSWTCIKKSVNGTDQPAHSIATYLITNRFQISVDRSLLSHSQALHLHPFAGPDPEPKPNQTKPNQSAPQRNSIPIRYLDLPKAASTAILTCLQPPQSAIKQYSPNIFAFPRLIILISTYSPRHLFGLDFLRSATPRSLTVVARIRPPIELYHSTACISL